jgi:hypothetical protein
MSSSEHAPAAPATSPPTGVVYVGPSLGRSLVGLAAAVLRPPARAPRS